MNGIPSSKPEDFFVDDVDMDLYMRLQAHQAYTAAIYQAKLMQQLDEHTSDFLDEGRDMEPSDQFLNYNTNMSMIQSLPSEIPSSTPLHFPTPAPTRGSSPHSNSYAPHGGFNLDNLVDTTISHHNPSSHYDISLPYDVENENLSTPELSPSSLPLHYYQAHNFEKHDEHSFQLNHLKIPVRRQMNQKRKYVKRNDLDPIHHAMDDRHDETGEKKRRAQVKVACVHCKKACKKCDDQRPCTRCIRIGFGDSCHDAPRKERKKGFKRGPYNKRRESVDSNGDWSPGDSGNEAHSLDSPHYLDHRFMNDRSKINLKPIEERPELDLSPGRNVYTESAMHENSLIDNPKTNQSSGFVDDLDSVPGANYYFTPSSSNSCQPSAAVNASESIAPQFVSPLSIFQPVV